MTESDPNPQRKDPRTNLVSQNPDQLSTETSSSSGSQVQAADQADQNQITQFMTTIRNAEEQVGAHIIRALQHMDTVAVITTLAIGPDGKQRVISAALDAERMQQVQEILSSAERERIAEEPCVGFHCLVKSKSLDTVDPEDSQERKD